MKYNPGESGNLNGRPKGSGHRQQLFTSLVAPHQDAILDKAIQLALNGNEAMLRLFLERLLPPKPVNETVQFTMPTFDEKQPASVLSAGSHVLGAIASGELTPHDAKLFMSVVEQQRKNIETYVLETRVAEIEKSLKQRKGDKE